ncbi:MAG: hypothetical protein ACO1Q7_12045 [Gemmatimonas sp.]
MSATTTGCVATARPRAGVVYVTDAPPRAVREVRPVSPGRAYVWIPGYYEYRGRSYVWVAGRWARPEFDNLRRWEPGRWRHDRNGSYWTEGRWR